MLMGLYPFGKMNFLIEESYKNNAVPPAECLDLKPWIDAMRLKALPNQT
jgi:hypothetical protein